MKLYIFYLIRKIKLTRSAIPFTNNTLRIKRLTNPLKRFYDKSISLQPLT